MTKTCFAVRHVHFEDLGSFAKPFHQAGYDIKYLEAGIDDLSVASQADMVAILGGPIGVYDSQDYPFLSDEIRLAESRLRSGQPLLGICLGAQIMAAAAGARVYPGNQGKELGWKPLQLTLAGQNSVIRALGQEGAPMLHWHGDTFDLPEGAKLLASTDAYPHQVYSIGGTALAFQCHPELDPLKIENWLVGHALEISQTKGVDVPGLRGDTKRYGKILSANASEMIGAWIKELSPQIPLSLPKQGLSL